MNELPSLCQLLFGWEISELENEICSNEYFSQGRDGPSTSTIALQELLSAFNSGLSRWELFADLLPSKGFSSRKLYELALFILTAQKFSTLLFNEHDDNDLSTEKILFTFFSGLDSSPPEPTRCKSVPEQVFSTTTKHYPLSISSIIAKIPESLVYALAALKKSAQGLLHLRAAISHQLWLFGPLSEREHIEMALLFLGDARVFVQRMRLIEVLERASSGRKLPENAVLTLSEELGIMGIKSQKATATKQKKQSAAARKRTGKVNPQHIKDAVKAGMSQKAVAIEFGISAGRVCQIMKSE
ncbi:hypothetical protein [Chromobacterium vaccinii]|uniref:hypothetical protein n=1 Tax=Chromobacterium vaccinii TaxID=1108595 RepID=UPI001E5E27AB|nr:hypothetical protein [Chromobacterium vaccinii]MCD4500243.1 hypothetical protein [Chromobacterium vaccinii]